MTSYGKSKKMKMKGSRTNKPKTQKDPSDEKGHRGPLNMSVPWGRGASEYRPGLFTKQYFVEHGEACCADVFHALKEDLERINRERIEIGDRPIRGCTYNSYSKYWHWFKLLGLVEPTGGTEPAIYDFLEKRRLFQLTDKGIAEERGWQDPTGTVHPEFR